MKTVSSAKKSQINWSLVFGLWSLVFVISGIFTENVKY